MSLHYWSASKEQYVEIAAMAYPHLLNAIKKLEAAGGDDGMNDDKVLVAMKAERARRDAENEGPPPSEPPPPWDEEGA